MHTGGAQGHTKDLLQWKTHYHVSYSQDITRLHKGKPETPSEVKKSIGKFVWTKSKSGVL
eukprot:1915962-Amphidinium_carterae.1